MVYQYFHATYIMIYKENAENKQIKAGLLLSAFIFGLGCSYKSSVQSLELISVPNRIEAGVAIQHRMEIIKIRNA